jgi:antitoxin HigA-1
MNTKTINIGMKPSHPGDFIRTEILDELSLTVSKAAEVLQVRRATLSDLVNGKAGESPEMALRIEKAFGVSMDTVLKMQTWFDTYTMREWSDQIKVKPFVPAAHR